MPLPPPKTVFVPPVARRWALALFASCLLTLCVYAAAVSGHGAGSVRAPALPAVRRRDEAKRGEPDRAAAAPEGGHANITIDESGLAAAGRSLTFAALEQWRFDPERPDGAPETVGRHDGRERELSGFMFPLESGAAIRNFCLLKTTQTCCYGPMPQFNQYVLVEMDRPVALSASRPVTVTGRFHVDPQPDEGYIYRMEGHALSEAPAEALKTVAR